ncbi:hypothetical protein RSAG8_04092, partial [Rhizoctonia solani AG-8 WAC10335]
MSLITDDRCCWIGLTPSVAAETNFDETVSSRVSRSPRLVSRQRLGTSVTRQGLQRLSGCYEAFGTGQATSDSRT